MAKEKQKKIETENASKSKPKFVLLLIGFCLSLVSFAMSIIPLLMLLVDGWGAFEGITLAELTKTMSMIAVVTGFVGVIFSVIGANSNKLIARLSFFFVIVGFFVGLVLLILSSIGVFISSVLG